VYEKVREEPWKGSKTSGNEEPLDWRRDQKGRKMDTDFITRLGPWESGLYGKAKKGMEKRGEQMQKIYR